jgi:MerR family transcriptional regulator, copper efflux regulator
MSMGRDGLLIGQVAARTGVSRKALRLYEGDGILPPPRRVASGYRVYDGEVLALVAFVKQAQRLGFRLDEIKEIVAMRRAGRVPCPHVRALVRQKAAELDQRLADLMQVRNSLRALLNGRLSSRRGAVVCPHIERAGPFKKRGGQDVETLKISLCPACDACPEVEIAGDEVRIGEIGNVAVLKPDEWNVLVDLIQSGQLTKI